MVDDDSTESDTSWHTESSRRKFISTAASAGGFAVLGSGVVRGQPPMKRVPKYIRGGEVIQWMKVPRAWLEQDDHAGKVKDQLVANLAGSEAVVAHSLVRSDRTYGGKNGFDIKIYLDRTLPTPDVPEEVSGVRVRTQEVPPDHFVHAGCYNDGNFSNYKGGMYISDNSTFPDTYGTAGYPVSKDGNDYMLTAQHVFDDCNWAEWDNTCQKSDFLGYIKKGSVTGDYVATNAAASGTSIVNKIREPDGTVRTVSGAASEKQISNRCSDPFDGYTQVGVTTGATTGGIKDKDLGTSGCNDLRDEAFLGGADGAPGDSGGPMYSVENGDAFILGHLSGISKKKKNMTTCGGDSVVRRDNTLGFPAYEVEGDGFTIGV